MQKTYGAGRAAYDLEAFSKSEAMAAISEIVKHAKADGQQSVDIAYDNIGDGSTRNGLMAVTILRMDGYRSEFGGEGITITW